MRLSPSSPAELVDIVRIAASTGRRLEVLGGGSKRHIGNRVTAEVSLDARGLSGIVDYDPAELVVTVRAGTPLQDLVALLASQGQRLGFDPPRSAAPGTEPTIGGMVATNLAGPGRLAGGAPRDALLGFEAVSGRGELFKAGGRVVKNVTGYDLSKLFAGSWGTLGIFTQLSLKVVPAPPEEATILVPGESAAEAVATMRACLSSPLAIAGAAYLPIRGAAEEKDGPITAIRVEGEGKGLAARVERLLQLLGDGRRTTLVRAGGSRALWDRVRDRPLAAVTDKPLWRLIIPATAAPELMGMVDPEAVCDWGGSLVWAATHADADQVDAALRTAGGHGSRISPPARGEEWLLPRRSASVAALERRVARAFDPAGILNPGRRHPEGAA